MSVQLDPAVPGATSSSAPADRDKVADLSARDRSSACRGALTSSAEAGVQCEMPGIAQLEKDKASLQRRLEFVEELIGPTEAQRKTLQEQIVAARSAALRAKYRGANLPTKVAGRLNENLLRSSGLSERDAGLLQGGCLPNKEGILQDVSLLGDPAFRPYDEHSGELRWHARGGMLQLSLGEVRDRFGDDVAHDVVRCAKELDKWDPSRRVGVELPWHPLEHRELEPAEVIDLMDRELSLQTSMMYADTRDVSASTDHFDGMDSYVSPYAVVNAQVRRGRGRRVRTGRPPGTSLRGPPRASGASGGRSGSAGSAAAQGVSNVVALPRVGTDAVRRGAPDVRCALPSHLRHRMQESLDHSLIGCYDNLNLF